MNQFLCRFGKANNSIKDTEHDTSKICIIKKALFPQ